MIIAYICKFIRGGKTISLLAQFSLNPLETIILVILKAVVWCVIWSTSKRERLFTDHLVTGMGMFSLSTMSHFLRPHGLWPTRLLCPWQEYWSGLPCPPPGDLPDPRIDPTFPALQEYSSLLSHWGSPIVNNTVLFIWKLLRKYILKEISALEVLIIMVYIWS